MPQKITLAEGYESTSSHAPPALRSSRLPPGSSPQHPRQLCSPVPPSPPPPLPKCLRPPASVSLVESFVLPLLISSSSLEFYGKVKQ